MPSKPGLPELCEHNIGFMLPMCAGPVRAVAHAAGLLAAGLAQSGTLNDPALVAFLDYLQYWQRPEYSTYIM